MCVTYRHDMTLAVKEALNPNTTNQPIKHECVCNSLFNPLPQIPILNSPILAENKDKK